MESNKEKIKLRDRLDPKYTKVCLYAGITTILVIVALTLLYKSAVIWTVALKLIGAVLRPLILGAVLCYLLDPLCSFFEDLLIRPRIKSAKKKGKIYSGSMRGLAVLITLIIVFGAILLLLTVVIWSMTKQLSNVNFDSVKNLFAIAQSDAQGLINQIQTYLSNLGISVPSIGSNVASVVSGAAGSISGFFFGVIFSIYFLIDGKRISAYWKDVVKVTFRESAIARIMELLEDADKCFSGYIRGQALDALLVGVTTSIIFILIGMPYAFLIGLIIGVGNLIPYVGPILGYGAVIIVNLTQFNPTMLVIGLVIMAVVMFVDGNVINPRLLAGTIKVHPLLVVASLLAGGAIGGVLGMLISVPTGAFVKLQFEKWLAYKKKNSK